MIDEFEGEHFFLSNFYMVSVEYEGIKYNCSKNAFQTMKTNNIDLRKEFANLNPGDAKRKGRKIKLRNNWEYIKYDIMYEICMEKFLQNPKLRNMLINTGDEHIVESNNWHDKQLYILKDRT